MHSYDPSRYPYGQIPAMRPARENPYDHGPTASPLPPVSPTPLYDALCAEYRRAFRTLPGDRSGEEDLAFRPFGSGPLLGRGFGTGLHTPYPGSGWEPHPGYRMPAHHPAALPPGPRRGL
ncbi:hypothetical protein ABT354_23815 [Streptomyces sp. NPDC000594]|uniref:hypothetical protein n=1 Tax=Streptomyces sp. NPDC000594 TaxID=3154261 RepID=UPI003333EE0E